MDWICSPFPGRKQQASHRATHGLSPALSHSFVMRVRKDLEQVLSETHCVVDHGPDVLEAEDDIEILL